MFGFIGAGATLGQLFGSLFATAMAWLGPCKCLCSVIKIKFLFLERNKQNWTSLPFHLYIIRCKWQCWFDWYWAVLLVFASLLMELAAQSSIGIKKDISPCHVESSIRYNFCLSSNYHLHFRLISGSKKMYFRIWRNINLEVDLRELISFFLDIICHF